VQFKIYWMSSSESIDVCSICPHHCGVNRGLNETGFCKTDDQPFVSSIFLHKGEEPIISGEKGVCNVFFAHCNLQCIYCQNFQISRNDSFDPTWRMSVAEIVGEISELLDKGVRILGFVSPSHQVPQMLRIIDTLQNNGYKPTIVYNSNGYDSVETLKELEGIVDVYLPDFKYYSNDLGLKYSGVPDYFDFTSKAIKEMCRQKGSTILLDDEGLIESGIIIRHLVLPNHSDDSIKVLEYIAGEISPFLHISLMSQYYPTQNVQKEMCLNRKLRNDEYEKVVNRIEALGLRGWIQDMESSDSYRPDFLNSTPFEL
jgi:putative pyruvate formate lyase activating enzyme